MTQDPDMLDDLRPGPCCACGREDRTVRNIVMLPYRSPEPGKGWGCVVCGLANDGAYAVLCDACAAAGREPGHIVLGYLPETRRAPVSACTGAHEHDRSLHPELGSAAGGRAP